MNVILFLVLLSIVLAGAFLAGFIWAVRSGQYEDTSTPAMRPLLEDPISRPDPNLTPGASPRLEIRPAGSLDGPAWERNDNTEQR